MDFFERRNLYYNIHFHRYIIHVVIAPFIAFSVVIPIERKSLAIKIDQAVILQVYNTLQLCLNCFCFCPSTSCIRYYFPFLYRYLSYKLIIINLRDIMDFILILILSNYIIIGIYKYLDYILIQLYYFMQFNI